MRLPEISSVALIQFLSALLNISSPTGYTHEAIAYLEGILCEVSDMHISRTPKGGLLAILPGAASAAPRAVMAHVDTLGAMVKEIKANGRLKLTQIGGYDWHTIETEGCTVFTRDGRRYRSSILVDTASFHVYGRRVSETPRNADHLEVRLDARTASADETRRLGIGVGDFIAFDPRVEVCEGFIRSRHLDDKAGVACLVEAIRALNRAGLRPCQDTYFLFTNYEEVGRGASAGLPNSISEVVVVDMAAVGEGQTSDEFHASLCVKDAHGPYDLHLSRRLLDLAVQYDIPYKVDIYPDYGSDGGAFWRAGGNAPVALIGPGVGASHNYERTHLEALLATTQWLLAYLLNE